MTERRIRWLFSFLLLGQLLLLTAQIPVAGVEGSYLEKALLRVGAPFGRLIAVTSDRISNLTRNLALNRTLVKENRRLRAEVDELRRRQIESFGIRGDLERLAGAVDYQRAGGGPLRIADIVFIDHTSWLQTLVLAVEARQSPSRTETRTRRVLHPTARWSGCIRRCPRTLGP